VVIVAWFVVLLVLLIWLVRRTELAKSHLKSDSISVWSCSTKLGSIIAFIRISIYWYLTYREWSGTQSFALLPLLLLLFPEGAALPRNWTLTGPHVLLFSGLLVIGSFAFGLLVAWSIKAWLFLRKNSN
jgi:hypothetical protein